MMRQSRWMLGPVALVLMSMLGVGPVQAQDVGVVGDTPVLLSSCGQSPGPTFVKLFLGRLGVDHQVLEMATAQDLLDAKAAGNPFKSLIIVTGASLKGMGAAGVSMREELIRTEALIAEAKLQGITIIGAHVEGMDRRAQGASAGDNSDEQSIDAVMPMSDVMVVRQDGDEDRRFTVLSESRGIPLVLFEKNMEMGDAFGKVLKK
ncbi:MAG: DUF6305 family protein [Longimicrobiales bacterium]|nr:DUF6305 family protein [Longimicrobiales bacterium]